MTAPISSVGLLSLQGLLDKRKEKRFWLKTVTEFLPVSFKLKSERNVSLFLSRNLFAGGKLKNSTWGLWVQIDLTVIRHPLNIALAILVRPDGSRIFLCPRPAVKLEKSKTVDLRNICV